MCKVISALAVAIGVFLTVAGGLAFFFGLVKTEMVVVSDLGPFDGFWMPADYCFRGGILAAVGSAWLTFAALTCRSSREPGPGKG